MQHTITTEYFKIIKGCMERQLDRNGWRWSTQDSFLLDWAIKNMEGGHDH